MHRLFVAIRPPAPVRDQLIDLMEGLAGARWQDEDQLHLTLRFIGEVDRHVANDVAAALDTVRHPAFRLALNGLGTFDRRGRPEALWAGVTPVDQVHALHHKIDQALVRTGLAAERRTFHPHITLARLGRSTGSVPDWLAGHGRVASAPFEVRSFGLYESQLNSDGALYTQAARYPLG